MPRSVLLVGWDDVSRFESELGGVCPRLAAFRAESYAPLVFSHPICSQSRQAVLFGSYGKRIGTWKDIGTATVVPGLTPPATLPTLPGVMAADGFATALVGKWHCGPAPSGAHWALGPIERGYQAWLAGTRLNVGDYKSWQRVDADSSGTFTVQEGTAQYATSAQLDAASAWWSAHAANKRFLHVCFNAPHSPWHVPPVSLLAGWPTPAPFASNRTLYRAMLRSADTAFGQLLDLVGPETVVFLYSDNGTSGRVIAPSVPDSHAKETTFDPGTNVILAGRWDGCPVGFFPDNLHHLVDLAQGVCAAAGVSVPSGTWDSRPTARNYILSESEITDGTLDRACRTTTMKLRQVTPSGGSMVEELYDLVADPSELAPLSLSDPTNVAALGYFRAKLAAGAL